MVYKPLLEVPTTVAPWQVFIFSTGDYISCLLHARWVFCYWATHGPRWPFNEALYSKSSWSLFLSPMSGLCCLSVFCSFMHCRCRFKYHLFEEVLNPTPTQLRYDVLGNHVCLDMHACMRVEGRDWYWVSSSLALHIVLWVINNTLSDPGTHQFS